MNVPRSFSTGSSIVTLVVSTYSAAAMDVYVSPGGDDSRPGTRAQPLQTLEAARDAVRTRTAFQPAVIHLQAGRYQRTTTFELGPSDSATADRPVVYQGEPGGEVWIDGGVRVPPDACQPVADEAIRARLLPEARDAVPVIDLKVLDITDYGTVGPRGFARAIRPAPLEIFVNGQALDVARWPNKRENPIPLGEVIDKGSMPRNGDFSFRGGVFKHDVERASRWAAASDWSISGIFNYGCLTAYVVGNVFYKAGSTGVVKFFRGGESPIRNNMVIDCPQRLQAQSCDHADFQLKEGSAVYTDIPGFERIPFETMRGEIDGLPGRADPTKIHPPTIVHDLSALPNQAWMGLRGKTQAGHERI